MDIGELLIGFLVGAFTGATGTYLAEMYTDRRKAKEESACIDRAFKQIKEQMGDLLSEMSEDLKGQEMSLTRDFFATSRKYVMGNASSPHFVYYEEDIPQLKQKVILLEEAGFTQDVTVGNTPKYRMTETLVERLIKL